MNWSHNFTQCQLMLIIIIELKLHWQSQDYKSYFAKKELLPLITALIKYEKAF